MEYVLFEKCRLCEMRLSGSHHEHVVAGLAVLCQSEKV